MKLGGTREDWEAAYRRQTEITGREYVKTVAYGILSCIGLFGVYRHAMNCGHSAGHANSLKSTMERATDDDYSGND